MVNEDYLSPEAYEGRGKGDNQNIVRFRNEQTKLYYFAWLNNDGTVLFRSEDYPTTSARDNGAVSVVKNRDIEARYSVVQDDENFYYVSLKAGNHQEIARSVRFTDKEKALLLFPAARARIAAENEAIRLAAANLPPLTATSKDDDYLACKEYLQRGNLSNDNFVRFKHPNKKFYFAWFDKNQQILLRSEGYPTAAVRDKGAESVIKNRTLPQRFSIIERRTKYFVILKAGNHQEIGRSCPYDSYAAIWAAFPLLQPPKTEENVADKTSEIALLGAIGVGLTNVISSHSTAETPIILPISPPSVAVVESEIEATTVAETPIILPISPPSVAVVEPEIEAATVAETPIILPISLPSVAAVEPEIEAATSIDKDKIAAILAATAAATTIGTAMTTPKTSVQPPPTAQEINPKRGFSWWWLLLAGLLLLALLFWWKSCNSKNNTITSTDSPTTTTTIQGSNPNTAASGEIANKINTENPQQKNTSVSNNNPTTDKSLAAAGTDNDKISWIFFDYNDASLTSESRKMLDKAIVLLKKQTDYTCSLKAFCDIKGDATYNEKLSQRRAQSAKNYLVSKGITAARISTSAFGKSGFIAKNEISGQDSEVGRRLNRRVEIELLDATGKPTNLVERVTPPANLKE